MLSKSKRKKLRRIVRGSNFKVKCRDVDWLVDNGYLKRVPWTRSGVGFYQSGDDLVLTEEGEQQCQGMQH